jgi:hypothetical protein
MAPPIKRGHWLLKLKGGEGIGKQKRKGENSKRKIQLNEKEVCKKNCEIPTKCENI